MRQARRLTKACKRKTRRLQARRRARARRTRAVSYTHLDVYKRQEFGMRLEDFGVVTEEGFQVFTQSTHDMVII